MKGMMPRSETTRRAASVSRKPGGRYTATMSTYETDSLGAARAQAHALNDDVGHAAKVRLFDEHTQQFIDY